MLYLGPENIRYHDGSHRSGRLLKAYAGSNRFSHGSFDALTVLLLPKLEGIGNRTVSHFGDDQFDFDYVLKTEGPLEPATRLYPWLAKPPILIFHVDGKSNAAQEFVFANFHPPIVIGEMHDAGEVGLAKFNASRNRVFGCHKE